MFNSKTEFIYQYLELAKQSRENLFIILVMNVKGITQNFKDYCQTSITSEYYSYIQYEEIFLTLRQLGYIVKCYFDENDFISDFELGIIRNNYPQKMLVINSAQKGTGIGRKSLIPAFCQLHNILYTNSNPYTVSFARNKYHWYCFLKELSYPVCPTWLYNAQFGWISHQRPSINEKVILKLNNESSSVGLTEENILEYSPSKDSMIADISNKYNQDVIVEKFISGYEVEVPVLISQNGTCSLFPAGISIDKNQELGDQILDYDIRGNHRFEHYNFSKTNIKIAKELEIISENVAQVMQIKNMGRVDYRIDKNGIYYITDIATNPHITKSMTFYYEFQEFGLEYKDVLECLIGLSLSWNST